MHLKQSEFNHFTPAYMDGTIIGFNAFTGVYFTLDEDEFIHCAALIEALEQGPETHTAISSDPYGKKLIEAGFLIDKTRDERSLLQERYHINRDSFEGLSLTIAPTVSCNFACGYCFQEHPKRFMSDEDMDKICSHIEKNLPDGQTLGITWFGGEPLAAFRTLRTLTGRIKAICDAKNASLRQAMITNGSLLTDDITSFIAGEAYDYLQITLDGPAEIHDTRRVTAAGKGTFQKILSNIKKYKGRLPFSLRVNIDKTNASEVHRLIKHISAEGLAPYVSLYFGHVLPYTDACGDETAGNAFTVEEFAQVEAQLQFMMIQHGMRPGVDLPAPGFGALCVADNKKGSVFAPGGLVFKCWNETALTDTGATGNLMGNGAIKVLDQHKAAHDTWQDYNAFSHKDCASCHVQPLCRGGCPWEARKKPEDGPGHCTPLKFNLSEQLRLYHLASSIDNHRLVGRKRPNETKEAEMVVL